MVGSLGSHSIRAAAGRAAVNKTSLANNGAAVVCLLRWNVDPRVASLSGPIDTSVGLPCERAVSWDKQEPRPPSGSSTWELPR